MQIHFWLSQHPEHSGAWVTLKTSTLKLCIIQYSRDEPTEEPPPDTSIQTLVKKCLAERGIDPTDIQNVMPVAYAKRNISSHESSRQIETHQRYVFARVN